MGRQGVWTCGEIPEKWKRQEPKLLQERGYTETGLDLIPLFEKKISEFAGSKYGISTHGCTNALFLSLMYLKYIGELKEGNTITIPSHTYISVPMGIINAGFKVRFEDIDWSGLYQYKDTRVWDGATRFCKDMFIGGNSLHCISFQYRKRLPIGEGGMVLTDDKEAAGWIKKAKIDARDQTVSPWDDEYDFSGWSMAMTSDDAARGILIFDDMMNNPNQDYSDFGNPSLYPDISNKLKFLRKQ
jgi:dTDP-4-amino-4,6-dideoxygalactose transaminase